MLLFTTCFIFLFGHKAHFSLSYVRTNLLWKLEVIFFFNKLPRSIQKTKTEKQKKIDCGQIILYKEFPQLCKWFANEMEK